MKMPLVILKAYILDFRLSVASLITVDLTSIQTDIEVIRLVNGITDYMGHLEILYNRTWGTVCDDFWSYSDTKVACRSARS